MSIRQSFHDHFLPHDNNDHVPHVLKHHVLFGYGVVLVLLKTFFLLAILVLPASSIYSSAITSDNVFSLTNATRQEFSLPQLKMNSALSLAATAKAENMFAEQYFAHVSPEGTAPWKWIKDTGYSYRFAGENLAAHFIDAEDMQDAWMASASHKANILNEHYTEMGVGVVRGNFNGHETTLVVEMFGTPKGEVASETSEKVGKIVTNAQVVPSKGVLSIAVETKLDSTDVSVLTENTLLPLEKDEKNVWRGELDTDVFADTQLVSVLANSGESQELYPLITYSPEGNLHEQFAFADDGKKQLRVFGVTITGLEDHVRQFYLAMIIFLSAVLLLSVMVKFHVQKHSTTVHALFVLLLATVLVIV